MSVLRSSLQNSFNLLEHELNLVIGSMSENEQTLMSEFSKIAYQNVELIKVGLIERSI